VLCYNAKEGLYYELISGNILATKNQIAKKLWVTDTIQIPRAILHKQKCLSHALKERVGMINEAPKALKSQEFWGLFSPFDSKLIAEANY